MQLSNITFQTGTRLDDRSVVASFWVMQQFGSPLTPAGRSSNYNRVCECQWQMWIYNI